MPLVPGKGHLYIRRCPASHPTHVNQTTHAACPPVLGASPAELRRPLVARSQPSSARAPRPPVSTSMDVSLGCLGVGHLHLTAARPQQFLRDSTVEQTNKTAAFVLRKALLAPTTPAFCWCYPRVESRGAPGWMGNRGSGLERTGRAPLADIQNVLHGTVAYLPCFHDCHIRKPFPSTLPGRLCICTAPSPAPVSVEGPMVPTHLSQNRSGGMQGIYRHVPWR